VSRRANFSWRSTIPAPVHEVFAWHTRPGAFERLNAPWRPVSVVRASGGISEGAEVSIRLPVIPGIFIPWDLKHTRFVQDSEFCDEQVRGPFRSWKHTHRFTHHGACETLMHDDVEYQLPFGTSLGSCLLNRELRRLFAFRHAILSSDMELHARHQDKPRKTVLIAGASGFVGTALSAFLSTAGHSVIHLVRREARSAFERRWNPQSGELSPTVFDGVDVVINLAGSNIAASRWTDAIKQEIERSRVSTTALLAETIATLPKPPELAIMASGVGCYGDTGDRIVDEESPPGEGFLSQVSRAWEGAAVSLKSSPSRLVRLRIGTVLNARGGALKKMLPPFRLGLGGRIGSGKQYMSWIALQDLLGVIEHVIYAPHIAGPVNAVAPQAVTNQEFTQALARRLKRPALFPLPESVVRAVFGEMGEALLLASSRVAPKALIASGYSFVCPSIDSALEFEVG
jgi:uncharacterized protein (TIGR01777 family)